jgi:hypothetical protein
MDAPWLRDPCPPAPFVSIGTSGPAEQLPEVLPGLRAAAPTGWADGAPGAPARARALALVTGLRGGVVVRLTAAWVWSGRPRLPPASVRVASAPGQPLSVDRSATAVTQRDLVLSPTRWCADATWVTIGGVAVTDPTTTAAQCLRLDEAEAALQALADLRALDLVAEAELGARLRSPGPARRGRLRAQRLVLQAPAARPP